MSLTGSAWLIEIHCRAFSDRSTELRVSFYVRESDFRARIVCKVPHSNRPSDYFCMPLNLLEIGRVGSCLQICRRRRGGQELVLWASLKFNTIERMCFVSLSQALMRTRMLISLENRNGSLLLHFYSPPCTRLWPSGGEHSRLRTRDGRGTFWRVRLSHSKPCPALESGTVLKATLVVKSMTMDFYMLCVYTGMQYLAP